MAVHRCVCFDVTFQTIHDALDEGLTLAQAHARHGFGARCGLCVPYIVKAIRSRAAVLPVMWAEDFEAMGIAPGAVRALARFIPPHERVPAGTFIDVPGAETMAKASDRVFNAA